MPVSAEGSALRALRVLEAVGAAGGPHRLGRIAQETGVTKPSTHRILHGLVAAGYAATDGDGTYGLGPRAFALSALFASGQHGEPVLRRLRDETGQPVHVALRSGNQAIYVQKLDTDRPYRMASRVGGQIPLHCTAIGKAILAHLDPAQRRALLAETGLPAPTARTHTDLAALEAELRKVRALGYAVDDEENEETVRCIGAPLLNGAGTPVGGVSVSTLTFAVPAGELLAHVPHLLGAARLLARATPRA
ncbi:IclR family transcriptional regulator [Amycolatopsis acidiphila]|uniref:IclR family transcriptional regulator n=1 Tax=Amycolatopsis acidiphila TaxID=715473 RepID=A0A558A566_9PSEU|nr:IclR family transcriptional regulator [Amycolatopsis acidiphila]TVT19414.1 IclR family transcriptional regulator [Amycolatopsis acidiphila]UIJ56775.1 IclR family transcriptional regulator [Amycolatopsis acidiphila]GHG55181.1 transcriptional regulator [Amycolatopsis acidiphila]